MGMSGTNAGGAGQVSLPRWQNRRVSPEALSSEQHTAPVIGQLSVPHVTDGGWHTPGLAHSPVLQRESAAGARQMPVPAQVEQTPLHAELQQTPSMQLPRAHSLLLVQAAPTPFFGAEQLPAVSHRLVVLHTCPALRGAPTHSCAADPQRPATQRPALTLGGKSRQVESAGHWITPHAASSGRFSQLSPEGAQRRHAPSQAAVQHTLAPLDVGWQLPAPQSALELHVSPGPAKQPPRSTLQPSAPHSRTVRHCPPTQRWKLEPEHCVASSSQTGAGTQVPVPLQISLGAQGSAQQTLPPVPLATQAPLWHSEPELQEESGSFFGRAQLP